MFISLRISLEDDVTMDDAVELAQSIAGDLKYLEDPDTDLRRFIDRVYFNVQEGDGNDLGM